MTIIIPADLDDLELLSEVIADAYFDLPPFRWLIADPDARRRVFPAYFRILLDQARISGVIWTTPDRDAAAVWIPTGDRPRSPPVGYPAQLSAATSPWTGRFRAFDATLNRRHPIGIPHAHLALLAVRPGRQGQGIGTALLRARHQQLDDARVSSYVEASAQRNRDLYLRHGYCELAPAIRLPGGPALYPLWREPSLRISSHPSVHLQ